MRARGGNGEYGLLLGIAFQIADDVLDCTGETIETGKVPGTDLRDGTPTLPLLLASREDRAFGTRSLEARSMASSSGRGDGCARAVPRVGDYASRARACLDGAGRRAELEALTRAVVERSF